LLSCYHFLPVTVLFSPCISFVLPWMLYCPLFFYSCGRARPSLRHVVTYPSIAFPQDDDEEPQKFVIPLPEPTLPSALKSRPPVTSLLPPTSASRTATQGPRKRVQWAAEVSKVALIENREELAELWDTGPDAAEMPVALLTPPPAPVRFVHSTAGQCMCSALFGTAPCLTSFSGLRHWLEPAVVALRNGRCSEQPVLLCQCVAFLVLFGGMTNRLLGAHVCLVSRFACCGCAAGW